MYTICVISQWCNFDLYKKLLLSDKTKSWKVRIYQWVQITVAVIPNNIVYFFRSRLYMESFIPWFIVWMFVRLDVANVVLTYKGNFLKNLQFCGRGDM